MEGAIVGGGKTRNMDRNTICVLPVQNSRSVSKKIHPLTGPVSMIDFYHDEKGTEHERDETVGGGL